MSSWLGDFGLGKLVTGVVVGGTVLLFSNEKTRNFVVEGTKNLWNGTKAGEPSNSASNLNWSEGGAASTTNTSASSSSSTQTSTPVSKWKQIESSEDDSTSFKVQHDSGFTFTLTSKKLELNSDTLVNPIGADPTDGKEGRLYSFLPGGTKTPLDGVAKVLLQKVSREAQNYNASQQRHATASLNIGEGFATTSPIGKNAVTIIHVVEPKEADTASLLATYTKVLELAKKLNSNVVVSLPLGPQCDKAQAANIFKDAVLKFVATNPKTSLNFVLSFSEEKDKNDLAIYKTALEALLTQTA